MSRKSKCNKYLPILNVLRQIQFWLETPSPPRLMLAKPSLNEFLKQKLPAHCEIIERKFRGTRAPIRRSPHRSAIACWPEDELVEDSRSQMIVVMSGNPVIRIADYGVHCRPGDFLFIPARTPKFSGRKPLFGDVEGDPDYEQASFFYGSLGSGHFSLSMRISRYQDYSCTPARVGETCWLRNPLSVDIFAGIESRLQKNGGQAPLYFLLTGLMLLLQEDITGGQVFDSLQLPSDSPLTYYRDPIENAQEYIQNHLNTPLSIDTVARWVGLSRSVFTRRFRAATGLSFADYLAQKRVERAKELLANTDFSINQISELCGLLPARLRKHLQKYYQLTPSQLRSAQRKVQKEPE